jgi:hypothetical protein
MKYSNIGRLSAVLALCICAGLSLSAMTLTFGGISVPGGGMQSAAAGSITVDFNGMAGLVDNTYNVGNAVYTFSGGGTAFYNGSSSGLFKAPTDDSTDYMSVRSPGGISPITMDFPDPILYFGMHWGSPDYWNRIQFYAGTKLVGDYSGSGVDGPDVYANFWADPSDHFTQIVMTSTQAALESDNHAYIPNPEPAAFVLLGSGLIAMAGVARWRNRKAKQAE